MKCKICRKEIFENFSESETSETKLGICQQCLLIVRSKPPAHSYVFSFLAAIASALICLYLIPEKIILIPIPIGNSNALFAKISTLPISLKLIGSVLCGFLVYGFIIGYYQAKFHDQYFENILPFLFLVRNQNSRKILFGFLFIFSIFVGIFVLYSPSAFLIDVQSSGLFGTILGIVLYVIMILLGASVMTSLGGVVLVFVAGIPIVLVTLLGNFLAMICFESQFRSGKKNT